MAEPPEVEALRRDYRTAFLRYLPRREEAALALAYEIGRTAVADRTSVLVIAQLHHEILRELVELAKEAVGKGERLYCRVCV